MATVEQVQAKIAAHKGHLTRFEKALKNAAQFCRANPSAAARKEAEILLDKCFQQKERALEFYMVLCEDDPENYDDYGQRMDNLESRYATIAQDAMKMVNGAGVTAAAVAAPGPVAQGQQGQQQAGGGLKVQMALKPEKLSRDNSPAELTSWARKFRAFYSMSGLDKVGVPNQQAFLFQCLDVDLEIHLRQHIDDTTTIFGDNGCISVIEKKFLTSYPLFSRRLDYFRYDQSKGQTFAEYYARLRQRGDEAELAALNMDALYVHRIICGVSDVKLKEKFCKLQNPTLADVLQVAETFEVSRKAMKDLSKSDQHMPTQVNYAQAVAGNQNQVKVDYVTMAEMRGKCFGCGYAMHKDRAKECKAIGSVCSKCGRKNHMSHVCFGPNWVWKPRNKGVTTSGTAKAVEVSESDKVNEVSCKSVLNRNTPTPRLNVVVQAEDRSVSFNFKTLPDTGASSTLIAADVVKKHGMQHLVWQEKGIKINVANESAMKYQGTLDLTLRINSRGLEVHTSAIVTDSMSDEIILGMRDLVELQVLPRDFPHPVVSVFKSEADGNAAMASIKADFQDVLGDTLDEACGIMKGEPMHIHLREDPNVKPLKVYTTRQIPIHMRESADKLVKELLEAGVIVPEDEPTEWVSPAHFVPKPGKNGKVRLVTDYRVLNTLVKRPVHPFPSAKDLIRRIDPDSKVFGKIDAIHGYFQIRLDEESSRLTTFMLPSGRYRYTAAPMGLCPSSDEFCRRTDQAFQGLDWFLKIVDDGLIQAPNEEVLFQRLRIVLERCRVAGIKISNSKLAWGKEISFAGYQISCDGVKPDPGKVDGIKKYPAPLNITELRSFLGMVNQLTHFIPDMAHMTSLMRELLKKKNAYVWTVDHQIEFDKLKSLLCSEMLVKPFNPMLKTMLLTDASRLNGIGYALVQKEVDGTINLIECNSMSLNDAQKNYATIEIECFGIKWAVQKCGYYLKGMISPVQIITDHRPLVGIFRKPLNELENKRLAKYREQLTDYQFEVTWAEGKNHLIADALSRAPVWECEVDNDEGVDVDVRVMMMENPSMQLLFDSAEEDSVYQKLISAWRQNEDIAGNDQLSAYAGVFDRMSFEDGLLVLDGAKVVVPQAACPAVLKLLHIPHTGYVKTLENAKQLYYWPSMASDIKHYIEKCQACQERLPSQQQEPLVTSRTTFPMEEVGIDLFDFKGQDWIVMVDSFSGFPFAERLRSTVTEKVVDCLEKWFLDFGYPYSARADGGPQFRGKFREYCESHGIKFSPSSPYYPQSNGLAESGVKIVKRLLQKCDDTGENFRQALMEMRNCPRRHGFSPSQMFLGRRVKALLPCLPGDVINWHDAAQAREELKMKEKSFYDKTAVSLPQLSIGDAVMIQSPFTKLWDTRAHIQSACDNGRSFLLLTEGDKIIRRNRKFLRVCKTGEEDERNEVKCDDIANSEPVELRRSPRLAA